VPDVAERVAGALAAVWHELVAPDWPRLRALLERDIVQRAGRLAVYGWADVFAGLGIELVSRSGRILLGRPGGSLHRPGGVGMVLMPNAFGTASVYLDPPRAYGLAYPAHGVAALWERAPASDGLVALLGRGRAAELAGAGRARRARQPGQHQPARRPALDDPRRGGRPPGRAAQGGPGLPHPQRPIGPLQPHRAG
jgi:hypothetical protein